MTQTQLRPAPLAKVAGPGISLSSADRYPENSRPLSEIQTDFLAARHGLDGTRARLTAELVWGRR